MGPVPRLVSNYGMTYSGAFAWFALFSSDARTTVLFFSLGVTGGAYSISTVLLFVPHTSGVRVFGVFTTSLSGNASMSNGDVSSTSTFG